VGLFKVEADEHGDQESHEMNAQPWNVDRGIDAVSHV
jgi:hypothetical protein